MTLDKLSKIIDILITNSPWMEKHVPSSIVYSGETCRTGSPRVDILLNKRDECRANFRARHGLSGEYYSAEHLVRR